MMPSLLPGYQYDIFISYRQKDNRSGQWVTHFVHALREELDATFKENISIYFDAHPLDGLHESHDVDGSLKDKIKCLVFIPIVSQTYCDAKSFAWQKEFLAFIDFAGSDQFGLNIKLTNGNVAKRILPVRIHDLEAEDKKLFEDALSGPMRAIDFIYQEPGVNRPLRVVEDHPGHNINQTTFRNQINKVSLAVKELVQAMIRAGTGENTSPINSVVPEINQRDSLVVLPFVNLSADRDQEYFCDGITEEIINTLTAMGRLRVIARTSAFAFKNQQYDLSEVAKKLQVNLVLEGSIRKAGKKIRLNANLINAHTGDHLWIGKYDKELTDIFLIQEEIAQSIAQQLKILSAEQFVKPHTNHLEAFNYYLLGRYVQMQGDSGWGPKCLELFAKSIEKDPRYASAHAAISMAAWVMILEGTLVDSRLVKQHALLAIQFDDHNAEAHCALAISKYYNEWKWSEAESAFRRALALNPSSIYTLHYLATLLDNLGRGSEALTLLEYGLTIDPLNVALHQSLGWCYFTMRQFEQSKFYSQAALKLEPTHFLAKIVLCFALIELQELTSAQIVLASLPEDNSFVKACEVWLLVKKGDLDMARKVAAKQIPLAANYPSCAAWMSMAIGDMDAAFEWLNRAVDQKDIQVLSLPVFSWWDPLRKDTRFHKILEKTGLATFAS